MLYEQLNVTNWKTGKSEKNKRIHLEAVPVQIVSKISKIVDTDLWTTSRVLATGNKIGTRLWRQDCTFGCNVKRVGCGQVQWNCTEFSLYRVSSDLSQVQNLHIRILWICTLITLNPFLNSIERFSLLVAAIPTLFCCPMLNNHKVRTACLLPWPPLASGFFAPTLGVILAQCISKQTPTT